MEDTNDTNSRNSHEFDEEESDVEDDIESVHSDESTYSTETFCSENSYRETDTEETEVTSPSPEENSYVNFVDSTSAEEIKSEVEEVVKITRLPIRRPVKKAAPVCRRKNMSFTNDELMRIERHNKILLNRILAQQRAPSKVRNPPSSPQIRQSSSAINRQKFQRKIDEDNLMILRKIRGVKPSPLVNPQSKSYSRESLMD